jgi:GntR family transcriptional regulator of arabinose operon
MKKNSKSSKRRNSSANIADELRLQFAKNVWPPGSGLPSNRKLAEMFGVSLLTMQRALERLRHESLIFVKDRSGTFVSPSKPSYSRYGMVFSLIPNSEKGWSWSSFNTGILREILASGEGDEWRGTPYFGVDGHSDSEGYRNLLEDLRQGNLSGLVFMPGAEIVVQNGIGNCHIPMVAFRSSRPLQSGIAYVNLDQGDVFEKSLNYLEGLGHRRIAVLTSSASSINYETEITAKISARGMETRPQWIQSASVQNPYWARNCMHLLMRLEQSERPDALIVTDDNLLSCAVLGLSASGVRVPEDLTIVTACNFPDYAQPSLPMKRIGFDLKAAVRTCVDLLSRKKRGESVPHLTNVEVIVANETYE